MARFHLASAAWRVSPRLIHSAIMLSRDAPAAAAILSPVRLAPAPDDETVIGPTGVMTVRVLGRRRKKAAAAAPTPTATMVLVFILEYVTTGKMSCARTPPADASQRNKRF